MDYRKIWKKHFGPIPIDEDGRRYDIHHIDGNRSNNDIQNLVALSIKDHYDIHYKQRDWNACVLIRKRLNLTKEEIEDINKKLSDSKLGVKCPNYIKEKISKTLTGRKHSKERVVSIMEGRKKGKSLGKGAFKDRGIERDNGRKGAKHSEETKKKIGEANSKALKGRKMPEDTRLKLIGRVPPNKGIPQSEEVKQKISDSKKGKPWTEARRLAQKNKKQK